MDDLIGFTALGVEAADPVGFRSASIFAYRSLIHSEIFFSLLQSKSVRPTYLIAYFLAVGENLFYSMLPEDLGLI